uniref:Chemokine interleukin-8-like domain-containing protein n=1 Tax=Lates calcarifer TaxID=8187 RepID=A0A4W6CPW4_LATCA
MVKVWSVESRVNRRLRQEIKTTAKMMPKPLLLLAALTLCCCIATLHASPRNGWCSCIRMVPRVIPRGAIKKIEVMPISGRCRRTEIIVTRRDGYRVCVDPKAKWINDMLTSLPR